MPLNQTDLVKVTTKQPLRGINPLLSSWTNVVLDYCKSDGFVDNCWWYNERASLSTLAGAAWRLQHGWIALEEYSTTKRGSISKEGIDSGNISRGRCDLAIEHNSARFAIEAKQAWQNIGSRAKTNNAEKAMDKARLDAGRLTTDEANHRLAAVFVVPYISISEVICASKKSAGKIDSMRAIEVACRWLKESNLAQFDAYAYVFPYRNEKYVTENGYFFPGVLLTIKRIKRGNRYPRV